LVLHRDIKHDNVLITAEGELRLIDFGVASLLDDPADEGRRGPVTFAYAAPEQLLGNPVSAATDIFAIGMLIHLLEAGSLPVRQSDAAVTIDTKRIADPDLDAVLAKATSFDPADRYGSVNALHDDLSSYLGGFAVAARPVSAVTKFTKLVARNKLATAMGGAAIAAVIAGVVGVGIFAVRANDARVEAELRAEAAEYFLAETNYANEVARVSGNVSQQFMVESQGINEADFRQFLIETADKTRAVYKENPEVSSAQVLFVARYLSNRGDYAKSKDMLAFLIAADETPDIALQDARVIQARNLRELGETKRAEGLLRDVLAVMKQKPYLFESPGYAQVAVNLALSSQGKEDLEDAVRANLVEATKPDTDKAMRAYFYNALAVLTSKLEDFDKTIEYGIKSVEYSKQAADTNAVSVNTRSLNLVGYILHHKKDVKLARSYWPGEADVMDPEKGHLRHRSMHRLYEAYALQIEGDAAAAYEKAKTAHELAVGEYPPGSPYYLTTAGMAIETGALAGKADEVRPLLESMMTPLESEGGKPHARAMIAHAFLLHAEGKRKQASEKYRQLDRARVRGSLELTYKAELLERELGIDS
ncbi:MAG: protein kinase, partial [Pseudomonadota bacterium]